MNDACGGSCGLFSCGDGDGDVDVDVDDNGAGST